MTKTQAINFFGGSTKLAKVLGITPHAIYQWSDKIPPHNQWAIALLSNWDLMPDADLIPAQLNQKTIKKNNFIANRHVNALLSVANKLAEQGRDDVIKALTVMADHNL